MNKEIITLDGRNNGFAIYSIAAQDYVTNKNGIVLFRNIDLARIYAANVKHLNNPYEYDLYISILGSMIHYDYFEKINGMYQFYATCDDVETKYFIKPTSIRVIDTIGYLIINNGEREFDKAKGFAKANLYYGATLDALNTIIKTPSIDPNISSIVKDKYGIVATVKNSTAKIHICYNSTIMTINQQRKAEGLKAFRFDKDMDKFTTLYAFIDIDSSEPAWFEGLNKAKSILNKISGMITSVEGIDTCVFKEVSLLKPMLFDDIVVKKN